TPLNDSHIFKIVECVRKLVLENTTFNTLNILPKDHKLHNLDILFTYGRVYENFKIDQLYEKAIDAILLNKRNYIITETGYLTGKGTFIPLDRISYTNNVKCSTADKFIKYNIILEKAFKYLLNGYHIVLNENDIQKHKINKELCVTLDGTVIDYRGTMTGGTLNLRYECSKKETFDSIQKVLDVLEENLNKICDKNITNEDESNDLGLKESESKGFKTNEDESKDSDTRNESGSKCFKTNESGSKCFKTNESGSNDSDTRNENESKGLKKSLMELKDLIARLISVSVRFSTVEGQKNNSLTINELKDFMNHCKSLPDMIDNLNDMILTYNKEQQRASTTINKLRKLIDQYDVIQTAIQNTSKNTSQTKNNLSLAELRSVLLDRKSQVLTYENEISQAQIMIDQCKKLFEKQLVIKNKKLELEDFIKSNVIKEQETMDFEKRKEIKRRILQLSSLQTDEEIIHEDLGSMTEIENIFDGLENTTTYDQLKEEAR
ncbi:Structural maintenance of chromosome protein, partial [Pseudoloma neurophilia]